MREITGSKGEELFKLLESTIQAHGLQMRNVVGESFDGAANMRGEHKGVQKFIKDISQKTTTMISIFKNRKLGMKRTRMFSRKRQKYAQELRMLKKRKL